MSRAGDHRSLTPCWVCGESPTVVLDGVATCPDHLHTPRPEPRAGGSPAENGVVDLMSGLAEDQPLELALRDQGYRGKDFRTVRPCIIDGCERLHYARRWCHAHYERWRKYGSPDILHPVGFASGPDHPDWLGDDVGYFAVHSRLRKERGAAPDHVCACGAPARDWSYQYGSALEQVDPTNGHPFSTDLSSYAPECRPCNLRRGFRHGPVAANAS